ncbi:1-(5-phosphoribosyl)-5-[(5-phosphoribosylamino)methylideneamino]imidazole-4-carboxamide isomerase [Acidocella sp.]|uniref:1-(5-phosphoribosyl)-5-[(5- phosphoribosylamino)methylideneamino]imidazole-4- carboxamide isomerase n=1 Tax=Acidocella sp. TaxID=50710 RepID=UPI003D0548D8
MKLTLYPAIDLKDGSCVRLLRGDMEQATVFKNTPDIQAAKWQAAGFPWIHVVDLNGAFAGHTVNESAVRAILAAVSVPVQLGGGLRDMAGIEAWLKAGISRVILGSAAAKNPSLVKEAAKAFPGQVAVGIDAKAGMVATEGWAETSNITATALARRFEDAGITAIIYTDISRDGMKTGLNLDETISLAASVTVPVIASGGVASVADITALRQAAASQHNLSGSILGRALYDGSLTPEEALAAC